MKALTVVNGAAFAVAVVASSAAAWSPGCSARAGTRPPAAAKPGAAAGSSPLLADHTRTAVPRRDYRRIVSASTVADALLLELCEPQRIAAFSAYGAKHALDGYRYAGKPTIDRIEDIEGILALHPDLVLVSGRGDPRPTARLREAGITIYDLGEMRGLATLIPNVHEVAELLGHPERGDRLARSIAAQMRAVASDVPARARRSGMYLSVYGGKLFGGASATSYHDVLEASGLVDAASGYRDWPQYSAEQILLLDPDVIVTDTAMRSRICGQTGLAALRACRGSGRIIEVDDDLLGDPGPAMIDAARAVRAAVYGPSGALPSPRR